MRDSKRRTFLLSICATIVFAGGLLVSGGSGGQAIAATPSYGTISTYAKPPFDVYKISANDTLYFIGKRYGVTVERLLQLNAGIHPYNLQPGQHVRLREAAPAQPDETASDFSYNQFELQVFELVNQERAASGLSLLKLDAKLSAMARDKAVDMYTNNYFDHQSPTYGSPFDMMRTYGISYSYAGENIAKGQRSPEEVMNAWMNSPGHRANILNANFDTIGVAYYQGEWVQAFIRATGSR